jgi:hypothetical protein
VEYKIKSERKIWRERRKVCIFAADKSKLIMRLEHIFGFIANEGFTDITLQEIDNYIKDIQNGTEDFPRFNLSEHAGLCTAGAPLIGASVIACYATASLTAGGNAEGGEGGFANWQIDECQEKLIEQWAKAANLWEDDSEQILTQNVLTAS